MNELNLHWTSGLTMTCLPLLAGVAQPSIAMTEVGIYGDYSGNMTGDTGGLTLEYRLIFLVDGVEVGYGRIKWDGSKEIPWEAEGIAEQVRAELATELGRIDVSTSSRLAEVDYTAPDNVGISAIPTNPLLTTDIRLNTLDAAISSRNATAPDNAGITAIKAKTDLIPLSPAIAGEYTADLAAIPTKTLEDDERVKLLALPTAADNAEAVMTHASAAELISNATFAKDIEGGKWEIDGTQMIFYKEDNTTEIARYNLFDINGNPSATDVYKRERVI